MQTFNIQQRYGYERANQDQYVYSKQVTAQHSSGYPRTLPVSLKQQIDKSDTRRWPDFDSNLRDAPDHQPYTHRNNSVAVSSGAQSYGKRSNPQVADSQHPEKFFEDNEYGDEQLQDDLFIARDQPEQDEYFSEHEDEYDTESN